TGKSYTQRQNEAVYPGFGEAFLRTLIGHVLKDRPEADQGLQMGTMGDVKRAEGVAEPSQAEQVFYNVNGTGGDGQQLWQWVASVFQRAGATGLRWVLTEVPPGLSASRQDELNGHRPYAVEFSPRAVTNWKFTRGQLQWCVVKIRSDTRRVVEGRMEGDANEEGYYLLVRAGVTELGEAFRQGGWWKFDKDKNLVPDATGTWAKTRGEIPMSLAVWEWETDPVGDEALPLARSATTALDNKSVAYMNKVSAWESNMQRGAGGPTFILGVDSQSWPIAREQWMEGASLLGVPASDGGKGAVPSVAFSGAAVVSAEAFGALLDRMTAEAERMMVQQATSAPESSGASKNAGFTESKAPRLTMLAENIESFLNTMLRFFELRFGHANPGAYVQMPRDFDLSPVEDDIRDFFDTFRRSQLRSATLETEAALKLGEAKGLVSDENRNAVRAELAESVRASTAAGAQERGIYGDLFGGAGGGAEAGADTNNSGGA
ncbi:MAG TPA: hypothetical protein VFI96_01635, partial [Longimicrobiaceae bacterium]|nr:hypothetical protein [Longimicrobiaceae bacterium]